MTRVEADTMDYWHTALPLRQGYPMTGSQIIEAHTILLGLVRSGETEAVRRQARAMCLARGIVAVGFSVEGAAS